MLGTPGRYDAIQVVAAARRLAARSSSRTSTAALHDPSVEVDHRRRGDRRSTRGDAAASLQFINMFLMTFAIVALVVGSFVIYNTFSITVAQRTKETALLRAIGAKRKQVMRSVMLEALFTGVFASAIGVVAGIGTAQGLRSVLTAFGVELPAAARSSSRARSSCRWSPASSSRVVAAYLPARKAAKVAPIEALRDVAVDTLGARRSAVPCSASSSRVAGAAFIAQGLSGAGAGAGRPRCARACSSASRCSVR